MIMLFFFLSRSANSSAIVVAVDSSCELETFPVA